MYLNNIQLLKLIVPFILVSILSVYSDDLVSDADAVFTTIKQYQNKELDAKANVYLKIQRNKKIYVSILNKIEQRDKNRQWITDHLLYNRKKFVKNITKNVSTHISKKVVRKHSWTLQILYPNKKVAIINSKIVHEGSIIDGAKVLDISQDKVLLKTKQGQKWLSLFQ